MRPAKNVLPFLIAAALLALGILVLNSPDVERLPLGFDWTRTAKRLVALPLFAFSTVIALLSLR